MIELYSKNINVNENEAVPFNNVALFKGNYVTQAGAATIQFNHCGVYRVNLTGSISGTGDLALQFVKDGVVLPQTETPITGTADADIPFAIETLVQVSKNNGPKCCQSPTELQVINAGVAATFALADIKITKVC